MLNSLKFQVTASLILLLLLFSGATGYTFLALEHQRNNDAILKLASRLQLTAQYLNSQAMRYKQHAPRDYGSYFRDVGLYYADLQGHIETFDAISDAFMHQDFAPGMTGLVNHLHPRLGGEVLNAVRQLERQWKSYRAALFERLGADSDSPRLEWAAEYILENNQQIEAAVRRLSDDLEQWSRNDLQQVGRVNRTVILVGFLLAVFVVSYIVIRVLTPLNRTAKGFRRVAQGDFGFQTPEQGSGEIRELTRRFNHLSSRLKLLFDLIERLQAGSDLNETLAFLAHEFNELLRIDWVGVLFVTTDGQAMKLETAYFEGRREAHEHAFYRLSGTLLEHALLTDKAQHISNMAETASEHPEYVFLRDLAAKNLCDAIFLPLSQRSQSPTPGMLVFAAKQAHIYDAEHLHLLNNIAQLVTHSFGRTAKLAQQTQLAAIGGFASAIAHEVRSPLSTISLALAHFQKLDLPGNSAKRATLAANEAARMGRLLEEMLLYAKPMKMHMETLSLNDFLSNALALYGDDLASLKQQRIQIEQAPSTLSVIGDRDRLIQVWLNLTRNACEAAPADSLITWRLQDETDRRTATLSVHNTGAIIAEETLTQLGKPFFTTKSSGAGLGLAIVNRIVDAHGGELDIVSNAREDTVFSVRLPRYEG